MLTIYESPNNLPVSLFGSWPGDQRPDPTRENESWQIAGYQSGAAGAAGSRWQLVPLRNYKLAQALARTVSHADPWDLYRLLTQPHPDLGDHAQPRPVQ